MQAPENRYTWNGQQYDHLFPRAKGTKSTVKRGATLFDTVQKLPDVVRKYGWQAKGLAKAKQGMTPEQTCQNLWNFCYRHISYKKDAPNTEQLRTTARFWHDGAYLGRKDKAIIQERGVDCDCFAITLSAALCLSRNEKGKQGIRHFFRIAKYPDPLGINPDPKFSHIYVVALIRGREVIIDPVTEHFDYEVSYLKKMDIPMDLEILHGPPSLDGLHGPDLGSLASRKLAGALEQAKREGKVPQSMTLDQYKAYTRQQFIERHGVTPEQWAAGVRRQVESGQRTEADRNRQNLERLRAELKKRGVAFHPNATAAELLELLRQNPPKTTGGKIVNAANKANPGTVLLRAGILAAMKINYFKIAEILRWGYYPESRLPAHIHRDRYRKVKNVLDKLRKIFYAAGGKEANLKKAILEGRGNRDKEVSLSGLGAFFAEPVSHVLGYDLMADEFPEGIEEGLSGEGLGEPAMATAIAAATAVLTAVGGLLKSIGSLKKDKGGEKGGNGGGFENAGKMLENFGQGNSPGNPPALPDGPGTSMIPPTGTFDPQGEGTFTPAGEQPPTESKFKQTWERNKWAIIGGGGLLLAGTGWLIFRAVNKPKPGGKSKSKATLQGVPIP